MRKKLNSYYEARRTRRRMLILLVFLVGAFSLRVLKPQAAMLPVMARDVTADDIARALATDLNGTLPEMISLRDTDGRFALQYTIDSEIQERMEKLISSYRPDYGAFVAMEADTGRIISLVSYSKYKEQGNLAFKGTFPAASIFKIVTAAAALDKNKLQPDTLISFNGANHTLYKRNVRQTEENRWTRYMTLREAFAKSVNTVFAKVGMFVLDPQELKQYAQKFRFNQPLNGDLPIEPARFIMPENNEWARAEIASGFNRLVTISPVHGAMMAAAIANDGMIPQPYLIQSVTDEANRIIYQASAPQTSPTISRQAAMSLREMMEATVRFGTSRKSFHPMLRRAQYQEIAIGGKTGSLTGTSPRGKYDWFVGYAMNGNRKIAIAALTINEETWKVKSSFLARSFIEHYFRPRKLLSYPSAP